MGSLLFSFKLILVIFAILSFLTLSGSVANSPSLPMLALGHAVPAPCVTRGSTNICSDYWVPAGPSMDTLRDTISSNLTELSCLTASPTCEDLTDVPLTNPIPPADSVNCSLSTIYCTNPILGLGFFAYLTGWQRVVNDENVGTPNFFTWLNAYNPSPTVPGTIRQGFDQTTFSVNPYIASSAHDFYVAGSIYDTLSVTNPLSNSQLMDWMAVTSSTTPLSNSMLFYPPPAGTVGTYRFSLRNDMYFQDGRPVTSFDVAFSYLSLKANGAFQSSGAAPVTGITLLGPHQLDINVNSTTAFTKQALTSLTILPGRYWTATGSSAWDLGISTCIQATISCYPSQFTLGPKPPSGPAPVQCALTCSFATLNMNADPTKVTPIFDPISSGILIGSGPFECISTTGVLGTGCSSSGTQNPADGGSYTLTRFGKGFAPASPPFNTYFRSSGNLALYIWTGNNGNFSHDFVNLTRVLICYNQPVGTLGCTHWQTGILDGPGPVDINKVLAVNRFVGVSWVGPFDLITAPPLGMIPVPPVLYEGGVTLNPCSIDPVNGYDC